MQTLRTIVRKTLLYKSGVEYADYSLNHAEGCSHGCTYPCYAMMMKKRCGAVSSYDDWIQPKIVSNALELLDKELPRRKDKINRVFLCFATDPFMYNVKQMEGLTLAILKRLNQDNIKAVLISKGAYPAALIDKSVFNPANEYGSTIVSLSEEFHKTFEPHAAPVSGRIQALRQLHKAGLKTWVSMEPYPVPNVMKQDIRKILSEVSFVDKIVFGKWNYNRKISNFKSYKQFYNSMAYEVVRFCTENSIDVHIKEGTINLDHLAPRQSLERKLLANYV
ncbi:MAG TPA: radical SAM protein [Anaerolineae bacterium]|nr:radical SAM protein [Anaerolineae bacterium]